MNNFIKVIFDMNNFNKWKSRLENEKIPLTILYKLSRFKFNKYNLTLHEINNRKIIILNGCNQNILFYCN